MRKELEKWYKEINRTVREFIQTIDNEYNCRMGLDFCACLDENVIEWTIIYAEKSGKAFYEDFIKRFPKADGFGLFTLSILHEVGHLETEDEMIENTIDVDTLTNEQYFKLHNEKIATNWAGTWLENNYKEAVALDDKFRDVITKFYADVLDD